MLASKCIDQLSAHLFWDVRREDVDLEKYPSFIIKRVLEYGLLSDWQLIRHYYGLERIVSVACHLRELEPRALAYLAAISQTPKEQFRCYTYQQSTPRHWNF